MFSLNYKLSYTQLIVMMLKTIKIENNGRHACM